MKAFYKIGVLCLALTLAGCATADISSDDSTYSGAARAAVAKTATNASATVRGWFSKPLPAWQPKVNEQSAQAATLVAPEPVRKDRPDAAEAVQTRPIDLGH